MFERPEGGERALLVQVDIGHSADPAVIEEFHLLAESAGAEIIASEAISRGKPEPKYFIGKGKAEELTQIVKVEEIELVIFNAQLSPSQERNLEKLFQARVLDRSGLVLDIFAQRAQTYEGKLQVELAQLDHLSTRLVRGWTHLERQKGGIGLRGPGETQLETDRRLLAVRMKQLKKRLTKVRKQREENRKSRERGNMPTIALAGYTNSGKSTLFNRLTDAQVYVQDQLFATLDPTWRKLNHDGGQTILVADTVGFVSDLPHELVAAFQSTLEETAFADLILHVIDYSDPERMEREAVVDSVLEDIGAKEVPVIRVYNKIDRRDEESRIQYHDGKVQAAFVSALTGAGIDELREALSMYFKENEYQGWLELLPDEGGLRSQLFTEKSVLKEYVGKNGVLFLNIKLPMKRLNKLQSQYNRDFELLTQLPKDV